MERKYPGFMHSRVILVFLLTWNCCLAVYAGQPEPEMVTENVPGGIVATAEFHPGEKSRPAVLLIHGFLQTRHYLTVSSLMNGLHDSGYSVLAPTLSLGINSRKRSLACEAIHTHTMQQDIAEISFWIQWLKDRGYTRIYLVGHSFGSLQGLVYLNSQHYDKVVKKLITTSLIDLEHSMGQGEKIKQEQSLALAKEKYRNNDNSLTDFSLSYCKKYTSPVNAYLSYAEWDKNRIVENLKKATVPASAILGSEDKRISQSWPSLLAAEGVDVRIIKGANHFFDAEHEFELLEAVIDQIKGSSGK